MNKQRKTLFKRAEEAAKEFGLSDQHAQEAAHTFLRTCKNLKAKESPRPRVVFEARLPKNKIIITCPWPERGKVTERLRSFIRRKGIKGEWELVKKMEAGLSDAGEYKWLAKRKVTQPTKRTKSPEEEFEELDQTEKLAMLKKLKAMAEAQS